MDKYRLSNDHLPSDLYRIDYPGSRTAYSPQDGFVAADTTKVYLEADEDEFKKDIVKQFTWACRDPLPFITLFSDREHAENWGFKQPWLGKMPHESRSSWSLCVIDTERLDSHCLFKLEELVASLELQLPNKAEQHINDAYLCMYSIPKTAIVEELDPDQVEISRHERHLDREYAKEGNFDYLDGYDSSEREAMQENWNTIFEKNMEDNW